MKYRLMAPGPTPIPEDVLTEMAKPILHHRTKQFEAVFAKVQEDLKWLFQTKNDVICLSSSGSGGLEAALINTCQPGEKILVVNGGKFGERFAKIGKKFGLDVDEIVVEWGHAVDPQVIAQKLTQNDYRAVCVQASETSTGVSHPIKAIADLVRHQSKTVLIVDAITALGVMNLPTDEWQIDILVGGSQKALMLPPGLSVLSVSDKAWSLIEANKSTPRFYFDLLAERKALKQGTTAWTPAVSLIMGLSKVLDIMKAEGLEEQFVRHHKMAEGIRKAAVKVGLSLLAPEAPSDAVTAIRTPDTLSSSLIVKGLNKNFNMTIADGQDHLKGKIFRIGHLGYYDLLDMVSVWAAVEVELARAGHQFTMGSGVAEIMRQF